MAGNLSVQFDLIPKLDLTAIKTAMSGAEKIVLNTSETAKKAFAGIGDTLKKSLGSIDISSITNFTAGGLATGAITGAVSTITDSFQQVISKGAEFEKTLNTVGSITGASGSALKGLGDSAKLLAEKFGGDVNSQLGAFQGILSKLGPNMANNKEALTELTNNVNLLAKAGGIDATQAMDSLTGVMLQFGIDASNPITAAKESARVMNILAAGAKEGSAEIPEVAASLKVAGSAAKSAGLSIEETNAALQTLAKEELKGAEAGTGLRNVLGLLQKQSGEGDKVLAKLGLTTLKLGTDLKNGGLGKAMDSLKEGLDKIQNPVERTQAVMQLFGNENKGVALNLLSNSKAMQELTTTITGTNEAVSQAQTNMQGYTEASSRFSAKISNLYIGAFEVIAPAIGAIMNTVITVFDGIGSAFSSIGGFISETFNSIANSPFAQVLSSVFSSIGSAIVSIIPTTDQLKGAFNSVLGVLDFLSPVIASVAGGFAAYTIYMNASTVATNIGTFAKGLYTTAVQFGSGVIEKATAAIKFMTSQQTLLAAKTYIVAAATAAWNVVQGALNLTFFASPLGATVLIIGALVGALVIAYKNSDSFRAIIDSLWEKIKGFGKAIADVAGTIGKFFGLGGDKKKAEVKVETNAPEVKKEIDELNKGTISLADTKEKKAKESKSLLDDIAKNERENYKLRASFARAALDDERLRAIEEANIARTDSKQTVLDEIEKVKREKNVIASERVKLINLLNDKLALIEQDSNNKLLEIDSKFQLKKIEEQRKADELIIKNQLDTKKKELELLQINQNNTASFDALKSNLELQKELRLDIIKQETENQINEIVKANSQYIELDKKYLDAKADLVAQNNLLTSQIASGASAEAIELTKTQISAQSKLIDSLKSQLSTIENNIKKDPIVKVITLKADDQSKKVIEELNNANRENEIKSIKDSTERERELKIFEAKKTLEKELELAKDNEEAKYDAYLKFNEAKKQLDDEALRKSLKVTDILKVAFIDVAESIRASMVTTTNIVGDAISGLQSQVDDLNKPRDNKDALKSLEQEQKAVFESAKKNEITISEFYQKSAELEEKRLAASKENLNKGSLFELKLRLGIAKTFEGISKKMNGVLVENQNKYLASLGDANISDTKRGELLSNTYTAAAVNVAASFGSMLATGTVTLKGMLGVALDALQSLVPIFSAQIYGAMISSPNPVNVASLGGAGLAAATGLTLGLTALVQIAKASLGFKMGVVDLAGPGTETSDSIPANLSKRESVLTAQATKADGNADFFRWANKTGGSLIDYVIKVKPELVTSKLAMSSILQQKAEQLAQQKIYFNFALQQSKQKESAKNVSADFTETNKLLKELIQENKKTQRTFSSKQAVDVSGTMTMDSNKLIAEMRKTKVRKLNLG